VDGVTVAVIDEAGKPLPDCHVGQIVVCGTSVAEGYVCGEGSTGLSYWRDDVLGLVMPTSPRFKLSDVPWEVVHYPAGGVRLPGWPAPARCRC
jgi:hypothetical protein